MKKSTGYTIVSIQAAFATIGVYLGFNNIGIAVITGIVAFVCGLLAYRALKTEQRQGQ